MRTGINISLILALLVTAPYLGLFTTTGIYLAIHMLFLGIRPAWGVLAIAGAAISIMYGFFGLLLGISMPGTLFI